MDHVVESVASRHTASVAPDTASASTAPSGPEARTEVCAGTRGSTCHRGTALILADGPPIVAARPSERSTHDPAAVSAAAAASDPDAAMAPVTGRGAEADQVRAAVAAVSGASAGHSAVRPDLPSTSTDASVSCTIWLDA